MQGILINEQDNVAVALQDLAKGSVITIGNQQITVQEPISRGHKICIKDIALGQEIIKYGFPIGHAISEIKVGEHVHSHNVKTSLNDQGQYTYTKLVRPLQGDCSLYKAKTFLGYARPNGDVGIRNDVWIIPTVFCVNSIGKELEAHANQILERYPNVTGVKYLSHPFGCSQMGDDQKNTQQVLAALTKHGNAGAVLILGLGCENNNLKVFKNFIDCEDPKIAILNCQDVEDEISVGYELIEQRLAYANQFTRSVQPLSKLKIGLKCGGSDGLSGITANPLIGRVSDCLVQAGGYSVMTEVPEMFGAEQLLMNRAQSLEVFEQIVDLITDFKHYFTAHHQVVSENPSPGNKAGGITTLEDKSLGCVQKGGSAEVIDVLKYTQRVTKPGLNLLQAPGNDGVSCTALACSGCHLILFSTGRGTPFATVVPTIKISTNSALFKKKGDWIDFNAGDLIEDKSFAQKQNELLDYIIDIASGHLTKSEHRNSYEMIIWKDGVTL